MYEVFFYEQILFFYHECCIFIYKLLAEPLLILYAYTFWIVEFIFDLFQYLDVIGKTKNVQ